MSAKPNPRRATRTTHTADQRIPIVAAGVSASGLDAFGDLLNALPPDLGVGFVLIPETRDLESLLSTRTGLRVISATDGISIQPNHIYVIPYRRRGSIKDGRLHLGPESRRNGREPIDDFMVSLAADRKELAIGILFPGTGMDGTKGLAAIKAAGGSTIVQGSEAARLAGELVRLSRRAREQHSAPGGAGWRHDFGSLAEREATILALLDASMQAIIAVNADGRIVWANDTTGKFFGYRSHELDGQPLSALIPETRRAKHSEHERKFFAKPTPRPMGLGLDLQGRRKDGSVFPVDVALGEVRTEKGQLVVAFVSDITEQRRLEVLAEANARDIRALAARLMTANEQERRRLSREIHDTLCQDLGALASDLGGAAAELAPSSPAVITLRAAQAAALRVAGEARQLAHQLHPAILDDLGLETALRNLCGEFGQREGIKITFQHRRLSRAIPQEAAACLYRVGQEALKNIAKHAIAKRVRVLLTGNGKLRLSIRDDGAGFDVAEMRGMGGLGLVSMEERARAAGGTLILTSKPGHGTTIEIAIPWSVSGQ